MGKFIVRGGNALSGSVTVGGSKNAALPVIFAALTLYGVSEIRGVSEIGDVAVALEIIEEQGAVVERRNGTLLINTERLSYRSPSPHLISAIRASTYLIGASLARFGRAEIGSFGGCSFAYRPIDFHLSLAEKMGANRCDSILVAPALRPATVDFGRASVGATVNFLIMASSTEGVSRLLNPATEPHIDTLIQFLSSAGAKISRSQNLLVVEGGSLGAGSVTVGGDPIEAGTYISAALCTHGRVRVMGAVAAELLPFLDTIENAGAVVDTSLGIEVSGEIHRPLDVVARAHPGFSTDLQPIIAPLMACYQGGNIVDTVFTERYGYLRELSRLGVNYRIDSDGAIIYPSSLVGGSANATDLRGGAACLITALAADGYSEITSASVILRGYHNPEKKLSALGADLEYSEL